MGSRITKAELEIELQAERLARHIAEERAAELEAELEHAHHTISTVESGAAAAIEEAKAEATRPAQPEVDDTVVAFVKRVHRANGPDMLNVRFTGEPVDGHRLARALGKNLNWVANEPRRDRNGRWWTNTITVEDAKAYSANQYLDATLPPVEAYEDA